MRDNDAETLSALMDGEATGLELRAIVRDAARDPELAAKWSRFHLASAVMHKQLSPARPAMIASIDLAARVAKALEEEPDAPVVVKSPEHAGIAQRWRNFANIAVAASVAAAVVVGWEFARPGAAGPNLSQATASANVALQTGSAMPVAFRQSLPTPVSPAPSRAYQHYTDAHADDRFNRYLISHSGNAALATHGGAVSYVRVVTLKPAGVGTHH
jgi:sigma-E factor negative regulatory protein RseA